MKSPQNHARWFIASALVLTGLIVGTAAAQGQPQPPPAPPLGGAAQSQQPKRDVRPPAERGPDRPERRGVDRQGPDDQGPDEPDTRPRQPRQGPPPRAPMPVYVLAVMYRLSLPAEQIAQLDVNELRQGQTVAEFDKAVRAIGVARLLYRFDQNVDLNSPTRIQVSTDQPYVAGMDPNRDAPRAASIARQNLGAILNVGSVLDPGGPDSGTVQIRFDVELSDLVPSAVGMGHDEFAPAFRRAVQTHSGPINSSLPVVLLTADAAGLDRAGNATVYLTRITARPVAP